LAQSVAGTASAVSRSTLPSSAPAASRVCPAEPAGQPKTRRDSHAAPRLRPALMSSSCACPSGHPHRSSSETPPLDAPPCHASSWRPTGAALLDAGPDMQCDHQQCHSSSPSRTAEWLPTTLSIVPPPTFAHGGRGCEPSAATHRPRRDSAFGLAA
jgi:hypothetical protein